MDEKLNISIKVHLMDCVYALMELLLPHSTSAEGLATKFVGLQNLHAIIVVNRIQTNSLPPRPHIPQDEKSSNIKGKIALDTCTEIKQVVLHVSLVL